MKNSILSLCLILASLFILGGCQSANEAEKVADQFHGHLKSRNYDAIIGMISNEGLAITPKEDWIALMKQLESLGNIKKVKKNMGFNTNISNGITTVKLNYTITLEKGTIYEELIFMREGSKPFKLHGYHIK